MEIDHISVHQFHAIIEIQDCSAKTSSNVMCCKIECIEMACSGLILEKLIAISKTEPFALL